MASQIDDERRRSGTEDDRHDVEGAEARAAQVRRNRVGDAGAQARDGEPDREPIEIEENGEADAGHRCHKNQCRFRRNLS